jgi:hypothetical protein
VHLTGAFHMAGYKHVIGTRWTVTDEIAAEVARIVYQEITTPAADAAGSGPALHHAIREIPLTTSAITAHKPASERRPPPRPGHSRRPRTLCWRDG